MVDEALGDEFAGVMSDSSARWNFRCPVSGNMIGRLCTDAKDDVRTLER